MPRRRLRTLTLWTGTLLSLLIAAAFVVSARLLVALDISGGSGQPVRAGRIDPRCPSPVVYAENSANIHVGNWIHITSPTEDR